MNEGGMKAFQEQQEREKLAREFAESCAQSEIELRQLLLDLDTALEDWEIRAFRSDKFTDGQINKSRAKVRRCGGTLAYIAGLRKRIKDAVT